VFDVQKKKGILSLSVAESCPAFNARRSRYCFMLYRIEQFRHWVLPHPMRKMDVKSTDANATENTQHRARVPPDSRRVPMANEVKRRYEGSEIFERGPIIDIA